MAEALHHQHTRKRIYQNLEPYPHDDRLKAFVDRAIYFVAFFGIAMTLPQLFNIWLEQQASGVSPFTWGAYTITSFFWFLYGFIHKEKPLMVVYSIYILLNILIVTGTLMYG